PMSMFRIARIAKAARWASADAACNPAGLKSRPRAHAPSARSSNWPEASNVSNIERHVALRAGRKRTAPCAGRASGPTSLIHCFRSPASSRAGVGFVMLGGTVAQHLEGVTALDQRVALGDQALEFHGVDFELALHARALRWKRSVNDQSRAGRAPAAYPSGA